MDPAIALRLDELNGRFYEDFAAEFSASRSRLNPGIERALDALVPLGTLLDLGCGDGRVGRAWAAGRFPGPVRYVGADRSTGLLRAHQPGASPRRPEFAELVPVDLVAPGWTESLRGAPGVPAAGFTVIVCFAVLHHVPDRARRVDFLRELRSLLVPGGRWALSVWQLLHLPRLQRRVVAWSEVGLGPDQVEPGDLLVDWRRGGRGLRYVHHYEPEELLADCARAGLEVGETFRSDGETGDLGLYAMGRATAQRI